MKKTKDQLLKKLKGLGFLTLYTALFSVAELGFDYLEIFNLPATWNLAIGYFLQQGMHIFKKLKEEKA